MNKTSDFEKNDTLAMPHLVASPKDSEIFWPKSWF